MLFGREELLRKQRAQAKQQQYKQRKKRAKVYDIKKHTNLGQSVRNQNKPAVRLGVTNGKRSAGRDRSSNQIVQL